MKCLNCGREQPDDAKFCNACGADMKLSACPICGHKIAVEARYCNECGFGLDEFKAGFPPRLAVAWREFFNEIGWAEELDDKKKAALHKMAQKKPSNWGWNAMALLRMWGLPIVDESPHEPWMIIIGRLEAPESRKSPLLIKGIDLSDTSGKVLWKPHVLYVTSQRVITYKPTLQSAAMPKEYFEGKITNLAHVDVDENFMSLRFKNGYALAVYWKPRGFILPPILAALTILGANKPTDAYFLSKMYQDSHEGRQKTLRSAKEIFSLFASHLVKAAGR